MLAVFRPVHANLVRCVLMARGLGTSGIVKSVEDTDDGLPKDYRERTLKMQSRRLDALVHKAVNLSVSQTEKAILTGKVHVNDEPAKKKAYNVVIGDVVDVWNQAFPDNPKLAEVDRIEIKRYEVNEKGYEIHVHQWKKFLVENWRGSS